MAQEDIAKTAIITPFGLFEFLRMPFGLRNAAQAFQRLMDVTCRDLPFVFTYIDDLLVASENETEHVEHLRILFERLEQNGLVVNPAKCQFGCTEIDFLGHHITEQGSIPLGQKVQAVREFPKPMNIKGLQEFVGMINFYNRFLPHSAEILAPLYQAIGKNSRSIKKISWSDDMDRAFDQAKEMLAKATLLNHPDPSSPIALTTDASDTAIGAVLEQKIKGNWQPLAFLSKKLKTAEQKYSTYDRELLAIYLGIKHFKYFLEGREFCIFTDHKPLPFSLAKISEPGPARQQRQLSFIAEFSSDIRHVAGKNNVVADALSRHSVNTLSTDIDFLTMARDQISENVAAEVADSSLVLDWVSLGDPEVKLLCDISQGKARPVVPDSWRRRIFDLLHGLSHPSVRNTKKIISAKFVWPHIKKQIGTWDKTCIPCQTAKTIRHSKTTPAHIPIPDRKFDHIHVDIVGPLPPSQGFQYLFTVVDRTTRWAEAFPLKDTSADSCIQTLIGWISRFGIPSHITSDRGSQFTSRLWLGIAKSLGYTLHHTTAYHPQANGMVGRFHRNLKEALKARLVGNDWVLALPWVMLGIRTAPKEDLNCSAAEMVFGSTLTVPGEFISPTHRQCDAPTTKFLPTNTEFHGNSKCAPIKALDTAAFVFVRVDRHKTPLCKPYEGPFRVIRKGEKTFTIARKNKEEVISMDRLKPAYLENHVNPPAPPSQVATSPAMDPSSSSVPNPTPAPTTAPYITRYGRTIKPIH